MLDKEFQYYIDYQTELVKKYEGKYIVIVNNKITGSYDTFANAITESKTKHKVGTFLIQQCLPGADNYTQTFHSRVVFS